MALLPINSFKAQQKYEVDLAPILRKGRPRLRQVKRLEEAGSGTGWPAGHCPGRAGLSPSPAHGVAARAVSTKRIDPVVQWLC